MERTVLFELEFGKIEKVSDGETTVYEYDGTPFADLSEKQIQEIKDSPELKKLFKVIEELITIFSGVFKEVAETIVPIVNDITNRITKANEEIAAAAAEKAKQDENK